VINPTNGKIITQVSEGTAKDVDLAVEAAQKASDTTWGNHIPGSQRGKLLNKLADLMESRFDELCAVEALDNGGWLLFDLDQCVDFACRQDVLVGKERRCPILYRHYPLLRWMVRIMTDFRRLC
jgi:acyl-CoA reductase-like NAD-dependent aldehyde dehydrogenase